MSNDFDHRRVSLSCRDHFRPWPPQAASATFPLPVTAWGCGSSIRPFMITAIFLMISDTP
jgi:hypothetical protein